MSGLKKIENFGVRGIIMCGIFGQISKKKINKNNLLKFAKHAERRGTDSSGLVFL